MVDGITNDELAVDTQYWADRVDQQAERLYHNLHKVGLSLSEHTLRTHGWSRLVRARVRHFRKLSDLAGEFCIPVPFLEEKHMVELNFDGGSDEATHKTASNRKELLGRVGQFQEIFSVLCNSLHSIMQAEMVELARQR